MKYKLTPDFYFDTFDMADASFLTSIGVRGILLDVDNTLEPYENPKPTEKVIKWFESLKACGIKCAIVSNNNKQRIDLFNKELGFVAFSKSKKPFRKNLIKAMNLLGTTREQTIFMGDQVFTDVLAARNAGIRAILVPPIKDKTDPFTKFKRLLEKPILKRYFKKNTKIINIEE